MAYVPGNSEWFIPDLVQEIRVAGSLRNIVHINYVMPVRDRPGRPDYSSQEVLNELAKRLKTKR